MPRLGAFRNRQKVHRYTNTADAALGALRNRQKTHTTPLKVHRKLAVEEECALVQRLRQKISMLESRRHMNDLKLLPLYTLANKVVPDVDVFRIGGSVDADPGRRQHLVGRGRVVAAGVQVEDDLPLGLVLGR